MWRIFLSNFCFGWGIFLWILEALWRNKCFEIDCNCDEIEGSLRKRQRGPWFVVEHSLNWSNLLNELKNRRKDRGVNWLLSSKLQRIPPAPEPIFQVLWGWIGWMSLTKGTEIRQLRCNGGHHRIGYYLKFYKRIFRN